jgi:hypothetical protein
MGTGNMSQEMPSTRQHKYRVLLLSYLYFVLYL